MWLVGTAWAQGTLPVEGDLHGPSIPIPDGAPSAPVVVQAGPRSTSGTWTVGVGVERFAGTADVVLDRGVTEPLLADGLIALVAARVSASRRLDLAASFGAVPAASRSSVLAPTTLPSVGFTDVWLAAPIGLVVPGEGGAGSWSVTPELSLPTGSEALLVGERGPTAGLRTGVTVGSDRALLAAEIGGRTRPGDLGGLGRGPVTATGGASFGVRPVGAWWIRAESRAWAPIGGSATTPAVEWFGTTSLGLGRTRTTVGAGRGLVGGAGAASLRVFASVSLTGTREAPEIEVPDTGPGYHFEVKGPDGRPVAGADVVVAGQILGTTGLDGVVVLDREPKWSQVRVRAPGYVEAPVERRGEGVVPVDLPYALSPLPLVVTDPEGNGIPVAAVLVDERGQERVVQSGDLVDPGRYELVITAPGFGAQRRVLDVVPRAPIDPVEAVLLPDTGGRGSVTIRFVDAAGEVVDGARVLIDGVPVGTTDEGELTLSGLVAGDHTIEVVHEGFTTVVASGVTVADDATLEVPLTLQRVPGTVRVRVRTPDGHPVDDAQVRFIGPRRLPPMQLGVEGERTTVLGAGEWTVTVTSPRYGLQERELTVSAERYDLVEVGFVLQPDEAGVGDLVVRVIDPAGIPVEGVTVRMDGRDYGTTSSGGSLSLASLAPGGRTVELAGDHLRPFSPRDVVVPVGLKEEVFTAAWVAGSVDVTVRGPDGPAADARVRFVGDGAPPPEVVGSDGHVFATLGEGTWTVVVTSPTAGIQERDVAVLPDARTLHRVEFVLAPQEDGLSTLALRVVDPDQRPISGARVSLDGASRGTTSNLGTARLQDLEVGPRDLVVWAEPYEPAIRDLRLLEGEQELEVAMEWASGATRVRVRRDGQPLDDALVRFLGDHPHAPVPVDDAGVVLSRLEPGFWLVVATSPTGGVAEWDLEVQERPALHHVDLDMSGPATGRTDLFVRVVDPYGRPVEHAVVFLDGDQKAGETQQGGAIVARDLEPRVVTLRVEAPDFLPTAPIDVRLAPGPVEQVVRISWPSVKVGIRAVDEHDDPVEVAVQWIGPRDVPVLQSDATGRVDASLAPGSWRAIARAADGRPLSGELALSIDLGDEPQPRTVVLRSTRATMAGEVVALQETVPFDFGEATLRPDAAPIVDEIAQLLAAQVDIVRLEVQGHTDTVGSVASNQALSQARAAAVVQALVARGVAVEKLVATGYGPTRPVADNATDEGRAKNRRVQFQVVERSSP